MLAKAIQLASTMFLDVLDKGGKPYILHCLRVWQGVQNEDEEVQQIAWLHDIIEDTTIEMKDLLEMGFSSRVVSGVLTLTKTDNLEWDEYIKLIACNPDARKVKLSDLRDNSNITRLKGLRKKDFDRLEKYHKAYVYLSE